MNLNLTRLTVGAEPPVRIRATILIVSFSLPGCHKRRRHTHCKKEKEGETCVKQRLLPFVLACLFVTTAGELNCFHGVASVSFVCVCVVCVFGKLITDTHAPLLSLSRKRSALLLALVCCGCCGFAASQGLFFSLFLSFSFSANLVVVSSPCCPGAADFVSRDV